MSEFAIYIPCVYRNITEEMIAQTFYRKKIGSVRHVELVPHNEKYNRAHVFFESMYPFGQGAEQMEKITNGETVKLQYSRNQHVFWVLMKNRREYDGVSKNGWYDPEQEDNKKESEVKEKGAYLQAVHRNQKRKHDDIVRQIDTIRHCTETMSCDPAATPWGYCMEPTMEPTKKSRSTVMPIQDKVEIDNFEMEDEEDDDAFGLVSVDYVRSLETELARMRMQVDCELQHNRPPMSPIEEHLMELRRDNFNMRYRYDELCRVKLPFDDDDLCRPVLYQVSDYEGSSPEYDEMVCREIDRIRRDNEVLNQNTNVLSCMPNSSANRPSNPVANENMMNDVFDQLHRPPSPITTPPGFVHNLHGFAADMENPNVEVSIPDCDCPMM